MSLELMSFGESAKGQTDSIQVYRESVHIWECAESYSPLWSLQNCTESGSQPCLQTSAPWGSWGGGWVGLEPSTSMGYTNTIFCVITKRKK